MNKKQLEDELEKERTELTDLRFDVRIGQEKDYAQIAWKKKEVARLETILKEKKRLEKKTKPKKKVEEIKKKKTVEKSK